LKRSGRGLDEYFFLKEARSHLSRLGLDGFGGGRQDLAVKFFSRAIVRRILKSEFGLLLSQEGNFIPDVLGVGKKSVKGREEVREREEIGKEKVNL